MSLPVEYRDSYDRNLINYDWKDVASGLGLVTFYAAKVAYTNQDEVKPILVDNRVVQADARERSVRGTTYVDFDTAEFNSPRVMRGDIFLTGEMVENISDDDRVVAKIVHIKNDGTTEVIGAEKKSYPQQDALPYSITWSVGKIKIRRGEQIRLKVKLSSSNNELRCNPAHEKAIKLIIPFEIE